MADVIDLAARRRERDERSDREELLTRVATYEHRGAEGLAIAEPATPGEAGRVGMQARDDDGHELLVVMTPAHARALARDLLITADAAEASAAGKR